VPRCKTPRWSLGASALVALAVAGCGAAADQPKLHNASEKHLLSLVAHARVDASSHDGGAVHAALGEFVSDVKTLKTSGQLSGAVAGRLDRAARATAAQAARQLHPATAANGATRASTVTTATRTTDPATTTQAADPATTTAPAANPMPPHGPPPGAANAQPQGNPCAGVPGVSLPGHGHGDGHAHGHKGWWRIVQSDGAGGVPNACIQWLKSLIGGGGD
jgi:hypothetical protein